MKKLLWFTEEEAKKLKKIVEAKGYSNSEAVRYGLDLLYDELFKDKKDGGKKWAKENY